MPERFFAEETNNLEVQNGMPPAFHLPSLSPTTTRYPSYRAAVRPPPLSPTPRPGAQAVRVERPAT